MSNNKMTPEELKTNLKQRLTEVEQKLKEIKEARDRQEKPSGPLNDAIEKLKAKKDDLTLQYDQIAAMETEDEVRLPELQKNIYNSLSSFDSAYTKAGALVEDERFRTRNRNIDFKSPENTL